LKEQAKQTYEEALSTAPDEFAKQRIQQGYQTVQHDLNGLWNDQKTARNGAYDWLGLEGIYGDSDANEVAAILAVAAAANTVTDYTGVKGIGESVVKNIKRTGHGQERYEEGQHDSHRSVGDANKGIREGRQYIDADRGHTVYVAGDRVVIVDEHGEIVTQFKNPRSNTEGRVNSGRWIPQ
jgi:hypothetical protein